MHAGTLCVNETERCYADNVIIFFFYGSLVIDYSVLIFYASTSAIVAKSRDAFLQAAMKWITD